MHRVLPLGGYKIKSYLVNSCFHQDAGFTRGESCNKRRQLAAGRRVHRQICRDTVMYGETGYHGAYAASNLETSNGMHRSSSQSAYQGRFGQAASNADEQHVVEEAHHPSGMPATHVMDAPCAYQGRFGTTPAAKVFERQHSGELERKGSAYHGHFGQ